MVSSANCTADAVADVKSSPMPTQTRTKTKATPQEVVNLKNLLPVLARLIESGKFQTVLERSRMSKTGSTIIKRSRKPRLSPLTRIAFDWTGQNCNLIAGSTVTRPKRQKAKIKGRDTELPANEFGLRTGHVPFQYSTPVTAFGLGQSVM